MDWRCSSTQYLESVTGRSGEVFGWLLNCQQLRFPHPFSFIPFHNEKKINRPFYWYGGHVELIGFKEYYGMPRGAWARSDILASVFTCAFWGSFSWKKDFCAVFGCKNDHHLFPEKYTLKFSFLPKKRTLIMSECPLNIP